MHTQDTLTSINAVLDAASEAAHTAGAMLLERPRPPKAATLAQFRTTFTAVDRATTALLRPALAAALPGAAWTDEFDPRISDADQWLVDPTDGAVQYLQDLPQWCITITLIRAGTAVGTVLHNPVLDETYRAVLGGGAARNGLPISPSTKTEIGATLVATSQPPFAAQDPTSVRRAGASLASASMAVGAIRNLGPTSWQVADVAAGRLDGFWKYGRDDTNLVGAALIAREAGLVVTDRSGSPWAPGADSFVAAPAQLHPALLAAVAAV